MLVCIFVLILTIGAFISDMTVNDTTVKELTRPKVYESGKNVDFTVEIKNREGAGSFDYDGTLAAMVTDEAGKEAYIAAALDYFEKSFIRDGESRKSVKTGIDIPSSVPENPCTLSFSCEPAGALTKNGNIDTSIIRKPTRAVITLTAAYERRMKRSRQFEVLLTPDGSAREENLKADVKNVIDNILSENATTAAVKLPVSVAGSRVRFVKKGERKFPKFLMFSLLLVAAVAFIYKDRNDQKSIKRKEELAKAYADFTGRFVILLGAGLSPLDIMKKLSTESGKTTELKKEITATVRQIENGMTEREAYQSFGRRCAPCESYLKFSSILTEGMKLGAGKILERLTKESETALEKRKNAASENGSRADTKMLLPMMLQLILVMVMIMVPAFMMT